MEEFYPTVNDTIEELIVKRLYLTKNKASPEVLEATEKLLDKKCEQQREEREQQREEREQQREKREERELERKQKFFELDSKRKERGLSIVETGKDHTQEHERTVLSSSSSPFLNKLFSLSDTNAGDEESSAGYVDLFGPVFCVSWVAYVITFINVFVSTIPASVFGAKEGEDIFFGFFVSKGRNVFDEVFSSASFIGFFLLCRCIPRSFSSGTTTTTAGGGGRGFGSFFSGWLFCRSNTTEATS